MIDTLSPDEVRRIAEQRLRDREAGRPLTPVAPGAAAAPEPPERTERQQLLDWRAEQREVYKRFRAFGAEVYWLSQPRRTKQTPGLGDLWCMHPRERIAWWWETKHGAGKLEPAQERFRELCEQTHTLHGSGGVAEAEEFLVRQGIARRGPTGQLEHIRNDT